MDDAQGGSEAVTKGSETDEVEETGGGNVNFTRGSDTDEVEDVQRGSEAENEDERGSGKEEKDEVTDDGFTNEKERKCLNSSTQGFNRKTRKKR